MKIEKISDERIKVTLQPIDMKKWNITYESLSTDTPETSDAVWNIILKITEETGMDFKNCQVTIEVIRSQSGTCVLFISKKKLQTRYKYKRKNSVRETVAIYRFKDFDDIINFSKNNLYFSFLFDGKNSIYRYKKELLLVINVLPELKKYMNAFNDRVCEYADIFNKPLLYACYLEEHFKPVITKNALKILYYKM